MSQLCFKCNKNPASCRVSFMMEPVVIVPVIDFVCNSCLPFYEEDKRLSGLRVLAMADTLYTDVDGDRNERIREMRGRQFDAQHGVS